MAISLRKQSLTTISKGQDIYEIFIPKGSLEIGRTYALVAKKQGLYHAYFFNTGGIFGLRSYRTESEK